MINQPSSKKHRGSRGKFVLLALILVFLVAATPTTYRLAYMWYHAKDLPSETIFTPLPVWYTEDSLPDHPAINVVEDNPDHDEFYFLRVYDVTPDENGIEPESPEEMSRYGFSPEPNHEYEAEIYCRNGADPTHNTDGYGLAKNVRLQVYLPHKYTGETWSRKWVDGKSYVFPDYISADIAGDNIFPVATSDSIGFYSSDDLQLKYVEGSAKCYCTKYPDGYDLDKQLFEPGGVLLNYDGIISGGREYACTVKFRFKVSKTTWYPWDDLIYDFHR